MIDTKFLSNFIKNISFQNLFLIFFLIICITTPIISFLFKINLSNIFGSKTFNDYLLLYNIETRTGGVVSDFKSHWEYINLLKDDLSNLLKLTLGVDEKAKLINFPLHHIIFSQLFFTKTIDNYLITLFLISFFLPIIFFKILKNSFQNLDKSGLLLLALIILILPGFQYSAIWGNNHITALIFFSIGIYYFKEFKIHEEKISLIKSLFFFSLASYTKQFYIFIFIYILTFAFKKLSLRELFLVIIYLIFLGFPGLLFTIKNPLLLLGLSQEVTNFGSSILISGSIMFFYLIPFIIQCSINRVETDQNFDDFYNLKRFIFSLITVIVLSFFFEYSSNVGGGIFLKLSKIIFKNYILLFLSSFLGIYFLFYFCEKNFDNRLLVTLLLITFSSGFFIFQKYFEPMFFIIFLTLFDKEKILLSIRKNNFISCTFFLIYYLSLNYIYFFGI